MRAHAWLSCLTLVLACGGSGSSPDGGNTRDAPARFDLGAGMWHVEQVSRTAMTISHTASLTILDDGTPVAAWAEPDVQEVLDEDIVTSTRTDTMWADASPRTNDSGIQNAYPRLVHSGNVAHLVWGGYPGGDNDLFYARYENGTWTARADLTTSFETTPANRRDDRIPAIAIGPQGELAIAYASSPADGNGNPSGPFEIRVLRLDAQGKTSAAPSTVIPAPGADTCGEATIAFDHAGKLHVVADCGPVFNEDLYYATDASGAWTHVVIPGGAGRDDYGARLSLDPDGATLHLASLAFTACSGGSGTCADVVYRRIAAGGTFGSEVNVTATGGQDELTPALGVDPFGRPIIAFHRTNTQGFFDIFVTWSEDGGTAFAAPRTVTPGTDDRDDQQADSIVFDALGLPHFAFHETVVADPINTEIMHAAFVP
jgi:hypothetical protein